jgi:hypothetical protein
VGGMILLPKEVPSSALQPVILCETILAT